MKYLPLLWAALRRRRVRSIFTLLSITIAFLLVGIMTGVDARFAEMIDKARTDRIVVSARFGAWSPIAYVDQIARLEGVTNIVPSAFLVGHYREPENGVFVIMTDERLAAVRPETGIAPEIFAQMKQIQNGMIVSRSVADRLGWKVGDNVPLETDRVQQDGTRVWTFRVVAVVPEIEDMPGGFTIGNFVYLNEGRADDRKNDIHQIQLLIADPARANETSTAIERLFANSSTPVTATPERTLLENGLRGVVDMKFVTYSVSAAALFMILFLAGNVMAQSVRERVPEFATMKAIGFSDNGIFALVLIEAAVLCLIGAGLGLLAAQAAPAVAAAALPNVPTPIITPWVVGFALVSAVIVAALSGLPAAWRVKQLSIAEALAGR